MVDRLLLWLGAGVIAGGVTVGMLAGAGTADAQTESDGDGGAKTSQSAKPAENEQDSSRTDTSAAPGAKPRFGRDAVKAINAVKGALDDAVTKVVKAVGDSERATVAESNVRTTSRPEPGQRAAKLVNNVIAAVTHQPGRKVVIDRTWQTDPVEKVDTVDAVETESTNVARLERRQGEVVRDQLCQSAGHVRAEAVESHAGHPDARATTGRRRRVARRLMCRRWSAPSAPPSSA